MHIIPEKFITDDIRQKHVVLELDTIIMKNTGEEFRLFTVVEDLPFKEIPDKLVNIAKHKEMVAAYKSRDWQTCLKNVRELKGLWNKSVDKYYDEIETRTEQFIMNGVDDNWDYKFEK